MNSDIKNLLTQLQQDKSLKVWSLIITFFGDVVLDRGGNVSARTVQDLLGEMGVGAGAVRTALSRLASDSWITRQKRGRESYYDLSPDRYELSQQAAARIYATVPLAGKSGDQPDRWQMAIAKPGGGFSDNQGNPIQITANCRLYFTSGDSDVALNECLVVCGKLQQVPVWVTELLMPETVRLGYQSLINRFESIDQLMQLSPFDCLVLRCLIIHEWRRLLLRTPIVPAELQTVSWPENNCRQFVAQLYQQLVVGSEAWLDEHATCITGALPPPTNAMKNRFTENYQSP